MLGGSEWNPYISGFFFIFLYDDISLSHETEGEGHSSLLFSLKCQVIYHLQ